MISEHVAMSNAAEPHMSTRSGWIDKLILALFTANIIWVLATIAVIVYEGKTGWLLAHGGVFFFFTFPLVLLYLFRVGHSMFTKGVSQTKLRTPSDIAFLILVVSHILLAVVGRIFQG
jgi:hypothetical protein